jgi:inhibitor of KinA
MDFRNVPAGDASLVVEFPTHIDPAISDRAVGLARLVREECAGIARDVVVGYCTVTVYFDPLDGPPARLEEQLRRLASAPAETHYDTGTMVDVPVCYGGDHGPDLRAVAAVTGLREHEVVAIHSRATYRVYVVGFVPGFPYMASVDPRLVLPRLETPRTRVPAGSVAIAAGQTGIYPSETPGGWHLIGRTPLKPFDPARAEPFAFKAGDRVRFRPIDREAFERESRWD